MSDLRVEAAARAMDALMPNDWDAANTEDLARAALAAADGAREEGLTEEERDAVLAVLAPLQASDVLVSAYGKLKRLARPPVAHGELMQDVKRAAHDAKVRDMENPVAPGEEART